MANSAPTPLPQHSQILDPGVSVPDADSLYAMTGMAPANDALNPGSGVNAPESVFDVATPEEQPGAKVTEAASVAMSPEPGPQQKGMTQRLGNLARRAAGRAFSRSENRTARRHTADPATLLHRAAAEPTEPHLADLPENDSRFGFDAIVSGEMTTGELSTAYEVQDRRRREQAAKMAQLKATIGRAALQVGRAYAYGVGPWGSEETEDAGVAFLPPITPDRLAAVIRDARGTDAVAEQAVMMTRRVIAQLHGARGRTLGRELIRQTEQRGPWEAFVVPEDAQQTHQEVLGAQDRAREGAVLQSSSVGPVK
jgi:hypothetical protein